MSNSNDFLSEKELAELLDELDVLTESRINNNNDESKANDMSVDTQMFIDEVDLAPLAIEENGSYVRIDEDNLTAWLYLMPPEEEREGYTKDELLTFLKDNEVMAGYHDSNIAAIIKKRVYEREIVVAKGQPAVEGVDGYFEYKFNPEQYKSPKLLDNGRVDYTNMSSLQNIKKGDVVAVYHHAKIGRDGFDVKGEPIRSKKVGEKPALRGASITNQDNPDIYLAMKDGKIEYKNGRIDIQPLHEINGDVTLIIGKIEFFGDVLIHGNVETGVVIRAGRNIEIKGSVEAVNLFAGGDIILSRGIQGAQKAKISARGNIFADFIENTIVSAGGSVRANTIFNSRIAADEKVVLMGKKGAIIGGYTHAVMGITATEIGNEAEIRTVVHAGCEKEVYTKVQIAKKQEGENAGKLKDYVEEIKVLRKKKMSGQAVYSERFDERLNELQQKCQELKSELEEIREEYKYMESCIAKGKGAVIEVNGNIYRGTVVGLAQMQIPIEHSSCFMKYFHQHGRIGCGVIAYS